MSVIRSLSQPHVLTCIYPALCSLGITSLHCSSDATNVTFVKRLKLFVRVLVVGLDQHSCSTLGPVSTRMGDCLRTGKPSQYVTTHSGQLSLAIPRWVGAVSSSESWGVNTSTPRDALAPYLWSGVCLRARFSATLWALWLRNGLE